MDRSDDSAPGAQRTQAAPTAPHPVEPPDPHEAPRRGEPARTLDDDDRSWRKNSVKRFSDEFGGWRSSPQDGKSSRDSASGARGETTGRANSR